MSTALLHGFQRENVIAVLTIVTFVVSCKMYNHFIAQPQETYSDVDITKMTILGIFSVFTTRAAVTALFERSIDVSSALGAHSTTPMAPDPPPRLPSLVKVVK
tara:strand:+ start:1085 stop:1393 length:309 start_codon:yes stop_codon:yes gene_type:complete